MKKSLLLLAAALAAGVALPARAAEGPAFPKLTWSGYVQFQALRDAGEGNNSFTEEIRRARLKLDATVTPKAALGFQVETRRGNIELLDAFLDYRTSPRLLLRGGQFVVPFSYNLLESPARLVATERPLISTRTFPNERDRGIVATFGMGRVGRSPVELQVGSFQGSGMNLPDNNNQKDILASMHLTGSKLSARLSAYSGLFTNPVGGPFAGQRLAKHRYGADAQWTSGPWRLEGLWARGKGDFPTATVDVPTSLEGWMALAAYRCPRLGLIPYAQLQQYDPDRRTHGNTVNGLQLGITNDLAAPVRYWVAWDRFNDSAITGRRDVFTGRAQVRF